MTSPQKKPSYRIHNGFRMPMGFPVEGFASGLSYLAQPGDIFIATYPKCGTTWTQHIVWLILHQGEPLPPHKSIAVEMPHLEEVGKERILALPLPRVIKTHLPYQMTPYHSEAKYIYVARNPFDCVVSFYHHTRGFIQHYDFAEGTFNDFFECFITGEVDFGDYFDHLLSWYEHRTDPNLLFLTYEAMKQDTQTAVLKIARFLGNQYLEQVQNHEVMNRIIEHSSFKRMSQDQTRWSSQRPDNMPPFIRKGEVGDWQNYLSLDQTHKLTEILRVRTQGTDIAGLWADFI